MLLVGLTACSVGAVTTAGGATSSSGGDDAVAGYSVSPFADDPAITGLDSELRTAVQDAARAAEAAGVTFYVSSGWRSETDQQELFDEAVERYGSAEAARAQVLPPEDSAHVTGDAVDIGPTDAMSWMSQHGADYGLCQTYANEMWHYELLVERGGECPRQAADASAG